MKRKIYIVGGADNYANWMEGEVVQALEKADLIVFTGGADVDPQLYGEAKHPETYSNIRRDLEEVAIFIKARKLDKHIIGICRGSQFTCVMSGGRLVQHQENPSFMHKIYTYDGESLDISSTHHQAQYPWRLGDDVKVLAWTREISRFHEDGNQQELPLSEGKEVEIAYYPKTKVLAIQGHPEMMFDEKHPTIIYLRDLLDKHMKDEIK